MIERFQDLASQVTDTKRDTTSHFQQEIAETLQNIPQKLEQILNSLMTQMKQLETKFLQEQKRLIRQIEEKDKLILSLTKINNTLLKQSTRNKKKSDAQFQYFVKRIAETECNALNDKRNLQQTINACQMMIAKLTGSQEIKRNNVATTLNTTQFIEKSGFENSLNSKITSICSSPRALKNRAIRNILVGLEIENKRKCGQQEPGLALKTYSSMMQQNPQKQWQKSKKQLIVQL